MAAKSEVKRDLSAVLWGMVGAWFWSRVGRPILDRVPFWWKVIGGLFVAGVLCLLVRVPELGYPVLVGVLGLIAYRFVNGKREQVTKPDRIVRDWAQTVAGNETLSKVLRGSTATVAAKDDHGFTVRLELAGGRTVREVDGLTGNLESVFRVAPGSLRVIADHGGAHRVLLRFRTRDPLERPVPWPGPDARRISDPLGLGIDENGCVVRVRLLGQHVLVAGVTGAGKSTAAEVLIRAVLAMEDADLWLVDCKPGGVEFGRFKKQAARFATEPADVVQLLAAAREEITERGKVMAENGLQTWATSPERRAVVLVIDELAELPPEAKVVLDSIVRLGRAMAVIAVMATQRPSASALGELGGNLRSQLTCTIGLRVRTPAESRIVFGESAQLDGFRADKLTVKGSFLIRDDEHGEPVPARCYLPGEAPKLAYGPPVEATA